MKYGFLIRYAMFALLVLPTLGGCYRAREEVRQLDAVAHLVFSGVTEGATATLQGDEALVWEERSIAAKGRYPVPAGTYTLTVYKESRPVVMRRIFLTEGLDFEVRVP